MATTMKLSPTMQRALEDTLAHGGELERRRGGWWTYPGCPVRKTDQNGYEVPAWSVGTDTVRALAVRGYVEFDPVPGGHLVKRARLSREPKVRAQ